MYTMILYGYLIVVVNNEKYFDECSVLAVPLNIHLGDDRILKATKIGNIKCYFNAFGKENLINIKNVLFVKEMKSNLLSCSKITEQNKIIYEGKTSKIIDKRGNVTAIA